jgi:hypothetical protein
MRNGITLTPTLSIGVDIMGIGVVLVSVMGLLGVAKGCRRLMNLVKRETKVYEGGGGGKGARNPPPLYSHREMHN